MEATRTAGDYHGAAIRRVFAAVREVQ